ncbi:putative Ig domain-containing protein [Alphaproteobacteria bacterium]|nr:putative Ig domain-containing protein [Alphaproteobacteria bacterium]
MGFKASSFFTSDTYSFAETYEIEPLESFLGGDPGVNVVTESDILARKNELDISDADWGYLSSLFPNDADFYNGLFFKWGDELGTAPSLTYSFVDGGTFNFDYKYTNDANEVGMGQAATDFVNFANSNSTRHMVEFSSAEKSFISDTLDFFSDISGIQFIEVDDNNGSSYGDLRFHLQNFSEWQQHDATYYAGGFAYGPWGDVGNNEWSLAGDVFLDSKYEPYDGFFETTVTHEIGHALGLSHPFDGYGSIGNSNDSLDNQHTVMTYDRDPQLLGVNPMPVDMLAMEFLYGGSNNANIGATNYWIDPDLLDVWENDFTAANGFSYGLDARMSIVDDGGVDIINANDISNGIFLNLEPGSWSNLSGINPYLLSAGDDAEGEQLASSFNGGSSLSIASDTDILNVGQLYIESKTYIEQCKLTDYGDIIFDNSSDNIIHCEGGDDLISLSLGNDQVFGGSGTDEVSVYGTASDFSVEQFNSGYQLQNINQSATNFGQSIYLEAVENISFYGDNDLTTYFSDISSYYSSFLNTNEPPEFDFTPPSSIDEDVPFSYKLTASDVDTNDTLTYSGVNLPTWLSVSDTGLLTGTPTNDDIGPQEITVKVMDAAGATDQKTFILNINNTNDEPVLSPIGNSSIDEDAPFSYQLTASDVDSNDTLTYSGVNLPTWLSVSDTGLLSGTPTNDEVGPQEITVQVMDVAGATDQTTFILNINNTNDEPVLSPIGNSSIDEDVPFSYQLTASDVDSNDTLTYSGVNLPTWLSVSDTGLLSGTPTNDDVGSQEITVQVMDVAGATDQRTFTMNIKPGETSITTLRSGDDKYYGSEFADIVFTGGGADYILAGAGEDIVIVEGVVLSTDLNPLDNRSNFVLVDTGTGNDTVEISTDFDGQVKLVSGGGTDQLVVKGDAGAFSWSAGTGANSNDIILTSNGTSIVLSNQMAHEENLVFSYIEFVSVDPVTGETTSEIFQVDPNAAPVSGGLITVLGTDSTIGDVIEIAWDSGPASIAGLKGDDVIGGGVSDDIIDGGGVVGARISAISTTETQKIRTIKTASKSRGARFG